MNWKSATAAARAAHPWERTRVWLQNNLKENWHLKLLSLAVAFALFAVSRQPSREILLVNVPLEFVNIEPGLEISGDIPLSVNVRLRGPRDLVQEINANQLGVRADLNRKTAGERVIHLKPSDVSTPERVEVRRIEPDTLELLLEQTRRKVVRIEPQFVGTEAEGFERQSVRLDPEVVEIEGPESQVAKVTKIVTESVPLTGRNVGFQLPVDLETGKQGIRLLRLDPVQLSVEIGAKKNTP